MKTKIDFSNLILGTAQFDPNYGYEKNNDFINSVGKKSSLLNFSLSVGINKFDTSPKYGDAQKNIQNHMRNNSSENFSVITKLIKGDDIGLNAVAEFSKLQNCQQITVLLHREKEMFDKRFVDSIKKLSDDCNKIDWGVSVYNTPFAEEALTNLQCNVIQIPISILNQEFRNNDFIERAKMNGKNVMARSIFTLGLLFKSELFFSEFPNPVKEAVSAINEFSKTNNVTLSSIAYNFILQECGIEQIIIGVNTKAQLLDIAKPVSNEKLRGLFDFINNKAKKWDNNLFRPELWDESFRKKLHTIN